MDYKFEVDTLHIQSVEPGDSWEARGQKKISEALPKVPQRQLGKTTSLYAHEFQVSVHNTGYHTCILKLRQKQLIPHSLLPL